MKTTASPWTADDARCEARWPLPFLVLTSLFLLPACSTSVAFMPGAGQDIAETVEYAAQPTPVVETNPVSAAVVDNGDAAAGFVTLNRPSPSQPTVRTAVLTRDAADDSHKATIIPLSHNSAIPAQDCDPAVGQQCQPPCFTPAECRVPPELCRECPADRYPDEYLCDGGDRELPVHYFAGDRQGFDTEDTIAEYSDHEGRPHVRASNQVCIYAPRFGSVEVIEGANSEIQIHHAAKTTEFAVVGSLERQDVLHQSVKEDGFVAVRSRRRADGAEAKRNPVHSSGLTRPERNDKVDQGLQAVSVDGLQTIEFLRGPQVQQRLANAAVWSRDLFPKLAAATTQAGEVRTRATAQATIGLDRRSKASEIHIVKLADRDQAEAGDTIRFTIRYINTGDYDLYNVRIVDNLTPRLHLLPDTVETDRAGEFLTEPNGEGSEIVTFVLDEALPAHKSGTIEFSVRVK